MDFCKLSRGYAGGIRAALFFLFVDGSLFAAAFPVHVALVGTLGCDESALAMRVTVVAFAARRCSFPVRYRGRPPLPEKQRDLASTYGNFAQ